MKQVPDQAWRGQSTWSRKSPTLPWFPAPFSAHRRSEWHYPRSSNTSRRTTSVSEGNIKAGRTLFVTISPLTSALWRFSVNRPEVGARTTIGEWWWVCCKITWGTMGNSGDGANDRWQTLRESKIALLTMVMPVHQGVTSRSAIKAISQVTHRFCPLRRGVWLRNTVLWIVTWVPSLSTAFYGARSRRTDKRWAVCQVDGSNWRLLVGILPQPYSVLSVDNRLRWHLNIRINIFAVKHVLGYFPWH